jgi:hypothetical protein
VPHDQPGVAGRDRGGVVDERGEVARDRPPSTASITRVADGVSTRNSCTCRQRNNGANGHEFRPRQCGRCPPTTNQAPTNRRLHLAGDRNGGRVINTAVVSNVAPRYAPPGIALIASTVLCHRRRS